MDKATIQNSQDYMIITADDSVNLTQQVNIKLREGWMVLGGAQSIQLNDKILWSQSIVKNTQFIGYVNITTDNTNSSTTTWYNWNGGYNATTTM